MNKHDIKNIEKRELRKVRHINRANDEREEILSLWKEKITPITLIATHNEKVDTLLVKFKFSKPTKIIDFYEILIDKMSEFV